MAVLNKKTLILAGAGIFLAGALAGGVGAGFVIKYRFSPSLRMEKMGPGGFFMERLDSALKLSPAQREAILPVVEDVLAKARQVREPCLRAEEDIFEEGATRIRAHLDQEQNERFTGFLDKARKFRKRIFGPGPGPEFGPPPPPPGFPGDPPPPGPPGGPPPKG
ncbi:hypothetical protein NNJEOMEG_03887 [Fundidesulfovibrio magnetotacticus]|uniref:Uncharacterized protein n=1 Tax=Fundidesulfovibrio magnetotacticus TaxID=2730080 RepID=A0A6V8LUD0_9BACT|nr:hypothetical protein [Fundidesulfovibrio magnetotacticus]GFK96013.1 hypothetical protein NNJEOMEG_03887 [Fundidesulfovibrio magnetotacticus]